MDFSPAERPDWPVASPEDAGLDRKGLEELYARAADLDTIRSLLVIKGGALVAEGYFNDGSISQLARLQSVTKGFTSALVGIAIDKGLIGGVDD